MGRGLASLTIIGITVEGIVPLLIVSTMLRLQKVLEIILNTNSYNTESAP